MKLTLAGAQRDAGSVSTRNSKMPGSSFAVTVDQCNVGGKLAKIEGSVCHKCYAATLETFRSSVHTGWTNNYLKATRLIESNPEAWSRAMAFQVERAAEKTGQPFHRWFDGGDLANVAMLKAIVRVCELTPAIRHWLPTREAAIVKAFLREGGELPTNLVVRMSATMIDDKPVSGHSHTSTVHKASAPIGQVCEARTRGNECGPCRACWSPAVANVSYPLH